MILAKIIRTLKSVRFTLLLIIALTVVFLLGVIIPQKDLLGKEMYFKWMAEKPELVRFLELFELTDIYISPITIGLWALFFLNLIFVMSGRIPAIWNRCFRNDIPKDAGQIKGGRHYDFIEGRGMTEGVKILEAEGYKVFSDDRAFWAVKNRLSPLATLLFHLSFFLLLVGGVMTFYTRFTAEAEVAAGETFEGNYTKVYPPKIGGTATTVFTIEEIKPVYYKRHLPVDLNVTLMTKKGRRVMGINRPYKEDGLSFIFKNLDVAPIFILKDEKGNEMDAVAVKLKVLSGDEDYFWIGDYEFRTVFYPDWEAELNEQTQSTENIPQALKQSPMDAEKTFQKEVVNPAFRMGVFKDGRLIGSGLLKKGESIKFDGNSIMFSEIDYWAKFYVVKEQGLWIVYISFAFITIAHIMRFVFYRRDIKGFEQEGSLYLSGRTDYFPSMFEDEFRRIADRIRGEGG